MEHAGGVGVGAVGDLPHQQFKGVTPFFGQAGIDGGQADIGETGGKDIVKTANRAIPRDGPPLGQQGVHDAVGHHVIHPDVGGDSGVGAGFGGQLVPYIVLNIQAVLAAVEIDAGLLDQQPGTALLQVGADSVQAALALFIPVQFVGQGVGQSLPACLNDIVRDPDSDPGGVGVARFDKHANHRGRSAGSVV